MKAKKSTPTTSLTNVFSRVAIATLALLLIPLAATQLSDDVQWTALDFVTAGSLIFTTGLLYTLIIKQLSNKTYRVVFTIVLAAGFLYLWAELAVGIFTGWGS